MRSRQFRFAGCSGMLDGRLEVPDREPIAVALFAHCFTCSKETVAASRVSHTLARLGIAVLRFDFTGLGGSEGDFSNTNFTSNVQDLLRAADALRKQDLAPTILIGHSLGGAAVLSAAPDVPEAKAVITIGAPSDPEHVKHLFSRNSGDITEQGAQEVRLAGRSFVIRKQFLDDIAEQELHEKIRRMHKALLIMHSPRDSVVDIEHAANLYRYARHPKSFISLDDADHMLARKVDAEYVANVISAWVRRYVPMQPELPDNAEQKPRSVVVVESHESKLSQSIQAGPHHLVADEPRGYGGADQGPSPYDFLLIALGTCTSMTLRMYAEDKKIPLQDIRVELRHAKIHAEDCQDCETRGGKIDRIERYLTLMGDLTTDQQARLREIADRCPVHRTLHSEVVIQTELAS